MSNKSSDSVHRLIKSLTRVEKRYFALFAARHSSEKNNYLKLFEAIDKQKNYDEAAVLKKFHHEAFVKKFPIAKARLYDAILRALDAFHANSSIDAQLKRDLHCAEILYKKSLYDQCESILSSAKRLAKKAERYSTLIEIFQLEKKLIEKDNYTGKSETDISILLSEDQHIAERIKNFNDYWNIKSRLFMLLNKQGKVRNQDELAKFKTIIDNTLLKTERKALSNETHYLYHHIYSAYYFAIGDYKNSYVHLKKNAEHIEMNEKIFREEPNIYFSVLTNLIYVLSQLKKYDEVFVYMKKLRAIPQMMLDTKNEDLEIKLFSSANSIELSLYLQLAEYEKGIQLVPKIEAGLEKYSGKLSIVRQAFFYFNIAALYFGAEKYSLALKWLNRLLNSSGIAESQDIYCFAKIFNMIIHIELKNNELIPYELRSLQRFLDTRNRVYKFETVFLNFANQLIKANKNEEQQKIYKKLKEELAKLSKDNFEKTAFEYFDFISWIESKIENVPFGKIVEKKAGK